MSNKIRTDIFGVTPEIGDTIIFNPPKYKGLVYGECSGFTSVGLPIVKVKEYEPDEEGLLDGDDGCYEYTPKTGFVVKKKEL